MCTPLGLILPLVGYLSDSPRPACPDLGAWAGVDLSVEDQAYFTEQADRL